MENTLGPEYQTFFADLQQASMQSHLGIKKVEFDLNLGTTTSCRIKREQQQGRIGTSQILLQVIDLYIEPLFTSFNWEREVRLEMFL